MVEIGLRHLIQQDGTKTTSAMTFEFDLETYIVVLGLTNGKYSVKLEGEKQDIIIFLSSKEYEILNDSVTEEIEFRIGEYLEEGRGEFIPVPKMPEVKMVDGYK